MVVRGKEKQETVYFYPKWQSTGGRGGKNVYELGRKQQHLKLTVY